LRSIQKHYPTILLFSCFFLICLGLQEVVLAGTIQLPQTGQTACYDSGGTVIPCGGTGQDGEIQAGVAWPNPRFSVSGDCVIDNLTGLMWAKNANLPKGRLTWQGSLHYVVSLNSGSGLCGFNDWRLPNVNELESLAANSSTWLNTQGFTNIDNSEEFWSSSYYDAGYGYGTDLDGLVDFYPLGGGRYVWPVRSGQTGVIQIPQTGQTKCYSDGVNEPSCAGPGQDGEFQAGVVWPDPRFTVSGDCVNDNLTGLIWAKNANMPNGSLYWHGALDYVASLNSGSGLCGFHDWRLPNFKELKSLIDYSHYNLSLPLNHPFINVNSNYYWSSTSLPSYPRNALVVFFSVGSVRDYDKWVPNSYVWPVRSGQGGSFVYLDHYEISNISSPQMVGVPFSITVTAKDAAGNTVTGFNGSVNLSVTAGINNPAAINLISGTGTGNVVIATIGNNIQIIASLNEKQGRSNAFNVVPQINIAGSVSAGELGLAGVIMNGLPGNPQTDNNGNYTGTAGSGWSGTVTPTLAGYSFSPLNRVYTNITANQTAQDYTANPVPATIHVNPSSLHFGYVPPGSYKDLILVVKNIGGGILTGTAIACPPFSILSGWSYSLGAGESQQVIVRYTAPLEEGAQTCSFVFTGGGGITVQMKGTNKNVGLPWLLLLLGN
jgi:hypothetical protein